MTLANLLAIHRLQTFEATPGGVLRLLGSAERNLADAGLTGLRKQRNLNDYEDDSVTDAAVRECLSRAEALFAHTRQWLETNRPDLLVRNQ
jgi:hypothetical protein